jgi:hypothetical protein
MKSVHARGLKVVVPRTLRLEICTESSYGQQADRQSEVTPHARVEHVLSGHGDCAVWSDARTADDLCRERTTDEAVLRGPMKWLSPDERCEGVLDEPYEPNQQPLLFTMSPVPWGGPLLLLLLPPPQLLFVMSPSIFRPAEKLPTQRHMCRTATIEFKR